MAEQTHVYTFRIPQDLYQAVRTLAFATNESIQDHLVRATADYLATTGRDRAVESFLDQAQVNYRGVLDKLAAT